MSAENQHKTNRRIAGYDNIIDIVSCRRKERIHVLRKLWSQLDLEKPRILDLGAGTGTITEAVLDVFPDATVVAVDGSEGMLAKAQKKPALQQAGKRIQWVIADFAKENWYAEISSDFDIIVSVDAIHHLEASHKEVLFGKFKEMLKPEGWLFVSDFIVTETNILKLAQYELWIDEVIANFKRIRSDPKQVESLLETLPILKKEDILDPDLATLAKKFQEGHIKEGDRPSPLSQHIAWLKKSGFSNAEVQYRYSDFVILSAQRGQS